MTTKITVDANHGVPVQVVQVHRPNHGPVVRTETIVDPNQSAEFYVHSFNDLEIHEIQPDPNST